jgi:hypothetical protein
VRTLTAGQQAAVAGPVTEPQYLVYIELDQPYYLSDRMPVMFDGNLYQPGSLQIDRVAHDAAELKIDNHDYHLTNGALDGSYMRGAVEVYWAYPGPSAPSPITNGDFASDEGWTLGDGWSIDTGEAYAVDPSGTSSLSQTGNFTIAYPYTVTLDVDSVDAGEVSVVVGGVEVIAPQTAPGQYSGTYSATPGAELVEIVASEDFSGVITSIGVEISDPTPIKKFSGLIYGTPQISEWLSISARRTPPRLYPFVKLRPPLANHLPSAGYVLQFDGAVLKIEAQR